MPVSAENVAAASPRVTAINGGRLFNIFYNSDGDSAEITGRAIDMFRRENAGGGAAFSQADPQSPGQGLRFGLSLDLPSPLIDWTQLRTGPNDLGAPDLMPPAAAFPSNAVLPTAAPTPNKPVGAAFPDGALPGSGAASLEALKPKGECKTCASRKYVDKSDDPSVSFQTPTNISASMSAATVASHENEHVSNERAKAFRDGREIVNQTVSLTFACCPECGKHYVSGGTTRTTTIGKSGSDNEESNELSPGDQASG